MKDEVVCSPTLLKGFISQDEEEPVRMILPQPQTTETKNLQKKIKNVPKINGKSLMLDALKNKMKDKVDLKIKAAKDAWAQLDKDKVSDGSNSQKEMEYSKSIAT